MSDIYLLIEGKRVGPYTEEQVKQSLAEGIIPSDLPAWHEGLQGEWVPISSIVENIPKPPLLTTPPPTLPVVALSEGNLDWKVLQAASDKHHLLVSKITRFMLGIGVSVAVVIIVGVHLSHRTSVKVISPVTDTSNTASPASTAVAVTSTTAVATRPVKETLLPVGTGPATAATTTPEPAQDTSSSSVTPNAKLIGVYRNQSNKKSPIISLYENNTYTFEDPLDSTKIGRGTYKVSLGKITFKSDGGKDLGGAVGDLTGWAFLKGEYAGVVYQKDLDATTTASQPIVAPGTPVTDQKSDASKQNTPASGLTDSSSSEVKRIASSPSNENVIPDAKLIGVYKDFADKTSTIVISLYDSYQYTCDDPNNPNKRVYGTWSTNMSGITFGGLHGGPSLGSAEGDLTSFSFKQDNVTYTKELPEAKDIPRDKDATYFGKVRCKRVVNEGANLLQISLPSEQNLSTSDVDTFWNDADIGRLEKDLDSFSEMNSKTAGSLRGKIDSIQIKMGGRIDVEFSVGGATPFVQLSAMDGAIAKFDAKTTREFLAYLASQISSPASPSNPSASPSSATETSLDQDLIRADDAADPLDIPIIHASIPLRNILNHPVTAEPTLQGSGDKPSGETRDVLQGLNPNLFFNNRLLSFEKPNAQVLVAVNVRSLPRNTNLHVHPFPVIEVTAYPSKELFGYSYQQVSGDSFCSFNLTVDNELTLERRAGHNDLYLYAVPGDQSRGFIDSVHQLTDAFTKNEKDQLNELAATTKEMMVQGPHFQPTPEIMVEVNKKVNACVAKIRADADQLKKALESRVQGETVISTPITPVVDVNGDELPPPVDSIQWRDADLSEGIVGNNIIYSHGRFLAVGTLLNWEETAAKGAGVISVISEDGINWTLHKTPVSSPEPKLIVDNADSYYLPTTNLASKDGTSWQHTDVFNNDELTDISYPPAVRYNDELLQPRKMGIKSFDANHTKNPILYDIRGNMFSLAVSPNLLVGMGNSRNPAAMTSLEEDNPATFTSQDGHSWTVHPEAHNDMPHLNRYTHIYFGLGAFWTFYTGASDTTTIYKSLNGVSWKQVASIEFKDEIAASVEFPEGFLVCDKGGDILYTLDGVIWKKRMVTNHARPIEIAALAASPNRIATIGRYDVLTFPISWLNDKGIINPSSSAVPSPSPAPVPLHNMDDCVISKAAILEGYAENGLMTGVKQATIGQRYQRLRVEGGKTVLQDAKGNIFKIETDAVTPAPNN